MNAMTTTTRGRYGARRVSPAAITGLTALTALAATMPTTRPATAQTTLDWPVGDVRPYALDTKTLANATDGPVVVFRDTVRVEGVAWLRLHFTQVTLAAESTLRLTSLHDGEVQELGAPAMAAWRNSSAYFNGNAVLVELVADAKTDGNRVVLGHVTAEAGQADAGTCGICAGDDRVPSDQDSAGRLLPAGCSATVWNEDSCVVSAGHCIGGNDVIQMRVPASNGDCSLNHPPVTEQFPMVETIFVNNGPGNDWSTMQAGENNLGETPVERYGVFRPIREQPVEVGMGATVFGYGIDSQCMRSQTQQVSSGVINSVQTLLFLHDVDTTFGNSGSSVLVDGEISGIATHCTCPTNTATRIDHPAFTDARLQLCACEGDANFDGRVDFADILKILANWGVPGGPSDVNDDGIVDFADILVVLANWGAC